MQTTLKPIHTQWSIQNEKDKAAHVAHIVRLGRIEGWADYMRDQVKHLAVEWPELPALVRAEFGKQKANK